MPHSSTEKRNEWRRAYYKRNRELVIGHIEAYRARLDAVVTEAKAVECTDCGVQYPSYVMEFDHVRGSKVFNLAHSSRYGMPATLREISKCDVVCANCHRKRTAARGGWPE